MFRPEELIIFIVFIIITNQTRSVFGKNYDYLSDVLSGNLISTQQFAYEKPFIAGEILSKTLSRNFGSQLYKNIFNISELDSAFSFMKNHSQKIRCFKVEDFLRRELLKKELHGYWKLKRAQMLSPYTDLEKDNASNTSHLYRKSKRKTTRDVYAREMLNSTNETKKVEPSVNYMDGDITGYAFNIGPLTLSREQVPQESLVRIPKSDFLNEAISSKSDYHKDHGSVANYPSKINTNQISLKDIIDVSLTTLAFLSFGIFVLQVIACTTMMKDDYIDAMLMPASEGVPEDLPSDTDEIRRRRRRSLFYKPQWDVLNQISRNILVSIDTMLPTKNYSSACLNWLQCKSNEQNTDQALYSWKHIFSFGINWMVLRMLQVEGKEKHLHPFRNVEALIKGFTGLNCRKFDETSCIKPHENES